MNQPMTPLRTPLRRTGKRVLSFLSLLALAVLPALANAQTVTLSAPTANQVFTAPATITVSASTTGTGIAKVEFYQGATLIGTDTTSPYSVSWASVAAGNYSLTAKSKNSAGTVLATSTAVPIIVNALPTVSITAPSANQAFLTGSTITLSANAADSDGTISKVDFYRGGTTLIGTATSAPYTINWPSAPAGSYSITAKATDNRSGVTTSTAVAITVANPPTVSLTAPTANQVFTAPATITLTSTATPASGATISKVEFFQGSTLIATDTTSPYSVTWSAAPAGSYSLTAKATDSRGFATTSTAVPIIVNALPTVSITAPTANQGFATGSTITLNATAADTDGTLTKVDFYRGGTTLIGTATSAPYTINWASVAAGSYSITAKATDNRSGVTTSTAVAITVAAPPTVSLTAPTANQVFTAPATITLTSTATPASGATIAKVDFYQGTTLIATDTTSPYSVSWSNAPAGSYSLTAKATDSKGISTTSTAIPIIVNALPTVTLTAPTANQVFATGSNITLTATAADTDGTLSKVDFYQGATLIGTATASPYSITWSNPAAGSYSLTAKATDNRSGVTTSTAVPIVIAAAPTVSLITPTTNQSFTAPATISLTATAAASSGATISKVDYYNGATLIGTATTSPFTASWSNVTQGSYSLTAKATDSRGLVTTSTAVPITVNANTPPTVSITSPANNASVTAPANITITATAADSDGTVSKVEFYQGSTLIGTATTAPYTATWSNVANGTYSLTAKATDNGNAVTTSTAVSITVNPAQAALFFIHPDHLGTPRLITDEANNTVWRSLPTTEPFGNSPPEEDPNATGNSFKFNLRFPGQYADQETNLNYNWNRFYDPSTGRYPQSDLIGLKGGINTYLYGNANPLSYIDPYGLWCLSSGEIALISGGVGGAVGGGISAGWGGAAIGAITGGLAGYAGATATTANAATGLGAAAGAGSSPNGPVTGALGGAIGGGISNQLSNAGLSPALSAAIGGGIGGVVTGGIDSLLGPGAAWPSLNNVAASIQKGGLGGVLGGIAGAATEKYLKDGNDCGCGK